MEGFPVVATGTSHTISIEADGGRRFYRVRALPGLDGFAFIPAGTFIMGSPEDEPGRHASEVQHEVTLTRAFLMKRTEVTFAEWTETRAQAAAFGYPSLSTGSRGFTSGEAGDEQPVTQVTWWDAVRWCNLRSEAEGRTPVYYSAATMNSADVIRSLPVEGLFVDWSADGYRLPTEAEWEYACRAGTTTAFHTGPITHTGVTPLDPNLDIAGWYGGNSPNGLHTRPVGLKAANDHGLFDMHGNVSEWCWDWAALYDGDATDPVGPAGGSEKVLRGGASFQQAAFCRSASRASYSPGSGSVNIGFRPVVTVTD